MVISLTDIKNNIETAMSVYVTSDNASAREVMRRAMIVELRRNKISKLCCSGFKVFLTKEKDGLGIDTTNISIDEECRCGKSYRDSRLLYVYRADSDEESHVLGCKCGYIYKIYWGC